MASVIVLDPIPLLENGQDQLSRAHEGADLRAAVVDAPGKRATCFEPAAMRGLEAQ